MIKEILGLEPQEIEPNKYIPSKNALKLMAPKTTNYENTFKKIENLDKKILVLCTEKSEVTTQNGKIFISGNHPVETFVPLLHLTDIGFEFEVFTLNGKEAKLEMWAMPEEDEKVMSFYKKFEGRFKNPKSLKKELENLEKDEYAAVFIPGGHGALLDLPTSDTVKNLLNWVHKNDLHLLSICHGPAALLSLDAADSVYSGYRIAAFPDSTDKTSPSLGYLPGQLTWFFNEKLKEMNIEIVNVLPDKTCHVDRKLITGASPLAANDFGVLCVNEILK